jgi:hypothetical protein
MSDDPCACNLIPGFDARALRALTILFYGMMVV